MTHTAKAVARALRDAAEVLMSDKIDDYVCCGHQVDDLGRCLFRNHPTPANVAIWGYPESYDEDGRFLG